jgi:hypothetical protein
VKYGLEVAAMVAAAKEERMHYYLWRFIAITLVMFSLQRAECGNEISRLSLFHFNKPKGSGIPPQIPPQSLRSLINLHFSQAKKQRGMNAVAVVVFGYF